MNRATATASGRTPACRRNPRWLLGHGTMQTNTRMRQSRPMIGMRRTNERSRQYTTRAHPNMQTYAIRPSSVCVTGTRLFYSSRTPANTAVHGTAETTCIAAAMVGPVTAVGRPALPNLVNAYKNEVSTKARGQSAVAPVAHACARVSPTVCLWPTKFRSNLAPFFASSSPCDDAEVQAADESRRTSREQRSRSKTFVRCSKFATDYSSEKQRNTKLGRWSPVKPAVYTRNKTRALERASPSTRLRTCLQAVSSSLPPSHYLQPATRGDTWPPNSVTGPQRSAKSTPALAGQTEPVGRQ